MQVYGLNWCPHFRFALSWKHFLRQFHKLCNALSARHQIVFNRFPKSLSKHSISLEQIRRVVILNSNDFWCSCNADVWSSNWVEVFFKSGGEVQHSTLSFLCRCAAPQVGALLELGGGSTSWRKRWQKRNVLKKDGIQLLTLEAWGQIHWVWAQGLGGRWLSRGEKKIYEPTHHRPWHHI